MSASVSFIILLNVWDLCPPPPHFLYFKDSRRERIACVYSAYIVYHDPCSRSCCSKSNLRNVCSSFLRYNVQTVINQSANITI